MRTASQRWSGVKDRVHSGTELNWCIGCDDSVEIEGESTVQQVLKSSYRLLEFVSGRRGQAVRKLPVVRELEACGYGRS